MSLCVLHGFLGGWGRGKEEVINYLSDFGSFLCPFLHFRSFFISSFFISWQVSTRGLFFQASWLLGIGVYSNSVTAQR